ncbi:MULTISPECIES: FAD-binding protein [unclassified Modestobacter]
MTDTAELTAARNWAGNHTYRATRLHRPASLEQVQEVVAAAARIRVLGSRHSFTGVADSAELLSLEELTGSVVTSPDRRTVTVDGGVRYGQLTEVLREQGLALHNLASLPHISVAGAVATATHGSGVTNRNLAAAVAGLQLVTSTGEVLHPVRGDADFAGVVVGLGALGAVTRVTLDVEPAFEVRQRVFEGLPWSTLAERFDEVMSAGYSVSLFTLFGEAVEMVWVKSRTDAGDGPAGELFGAREADGERHPIPGLPSGPATVQQGVPGLWSDRLPHFRMGFTPSNGEEIQSEFLVPHRHAVAAIDALRSLGDRIRPLLQTCEIRTVAADELWMSTAYDEASVALHFTWLPDQPAVEELLVHLEGALEPFGPRPHWGKLFLADAATIAAHYPRHRDFLALTERLDPRGAFRNDWFERYVAGAR